MKTKIEELWAESHRQVAFQPIYPNGFRLLRIDPGSSFDIYAGIDASSFVLLAIGVHRRPPNVAINSTSLDYFRQQRHDGSWLMVLRLRQGALEGVFGRLCQDLVDATGRVAGEDALIALFRERLNLWQKLFQNAGGGLLQPHQIKGLIAELLVLESVIESGCRDIPEALTGWIGPLGADQDFLYSDEAIEVKSIAPGAECISISSLGQLDCSVPIRLEAITLRQAAYGESGAISLNSLVARIEGVIASSSEALATFKDRLLEGCYIEHEYYDSVLFEPVSRESFDVGDEFPKLTTRMVAAGIVGANYSIALDVIRANSKPSN